MSLLYPKQDTAVPLKFFLFLACWVWNGKGKGKSILTSFINRYDTFHWRIYCHLYYAWDKVFLWIYGFWWNLVLAGVKTEIVRKFSFHIRCYFIQNSHLNISYSTSTMLWKQVTGNCHWYKYIMGHAVW
jgi:hypothetical protein